VRGGKRALFESFGLGKSVQQLEILRIILSKLGGGRALIVAPLGVRQEFIRGTQKMLGTGLTFRASHKPRSTRPESTSRITNR
jgi:hypothetical protein